VWCSRRGIKNKVGRLGTSVKHSGGRPPPCLNDFVCCPLLSASLPWPVQINDEVIKVYIIAYRVPLTVCCILVAFLCSSPYYDFLFFWFYRREDEEVRFAHFELGLLGHQRRRRILVWSNNILQFELDYYHLDLWNLLNGRECSMLIYYAAACPPTNQDWA